MFCPEGFISWDTATNTLWEWADELSRPQGDLTVDPMARSFAVELLFAWLTANILLDIEPLICSPDGRLLQAPYAYRLHGDRLDWCSIRRPMDKLPEYQFFFERHARGLFKIEDLVSRFCLIDGVSGQIHIKNNSSLMLNKYCGFSEQDALITIKTARHHQGWAICWRPDSFPKTFEAMMDRLGLAIIEEVSRREPSDGHRSAARGGRPAYGPRICAAYDVLYPNGHLVTGDTWEHVARKIAGSIGIAVKANTVSRAINARSKEKP